MPEKLDKHQRWADEASGLLRSVAFSMVLGFHNAMEQEDHGLEELRMRFHTELRAPVGHPLERPERCFFWAESSLMN